MKKITQDFYVYAWYNTDTNEVFYIGKGKGRRYLSTTSRNQYFLDYIASHNTDVIILIDNLFEEQAFIYEKILTDEYKQQGQCSCNLAPAGQGGCHYVWTDEMKAYWSQYNPMKRIEQRERMRLNNPMHNKEIAMRNGAAHKNPVFIGEKTYDGIVDAAKDVQVAESTLRKWLIRGTTPNQIKCGYVNEIKSTTKGNPVKIDDIEYPSLAAAARAINVAPNSLRNALKNNRPCKNHKCEYVNQQPSQ